ncbi:MAG TPA: hypothetical protein VJ302_22135, partial [Blastocatellia bacterium]|nr:hypothetical protein [Blastocatellia bacterium]
ISRDYARQHLTQGVWISVTQIGQVMLTGTELIIIGKLVGPAAVVVYACTNKLIGVLANQPQMVMQAASPALSELRVSESGQRVFQVWSTLSLAMLTLSGLVVFVVLTVNEGFVNWWIGNSQFGGYGLTILLLLTMMLRHWNLTWIYALICFGRERLVSIVNLTDGLVTILGTIGLVYAFGLKGAPLASILGVCLISQPCYFRALIAETKVSPLTLLGLIWPWLQRFIGLIIAGTLLRRYWVPKTFAEIAVAGAATVLLYAIVMLPVVLRSDLGRYVRPKLGGMRSRFVRIRQSFGAA